MERFGPIQEMEIEKQAVWRRNYDQRDWRKLRELQSFQEKTRHINAIYQKKQGENRETAKPVAQIQPPPFSIKMKFSLENGFRLADDAFAHFLPTAAQLGAPTASNAKALAPLQDECRLDFASLTSEFGDEAGHQALEVTYKEVVEQMRAEALKNDDYISPRQCAFCNKEGFDFSVCTKCKVTVYCSLKCQKDNHRNHDRECQNIVETRMKEIVKNVKIPNCRENRAKKATTNGRKKNGKKR